MKAEPSAACGNCVPPSGQQPASMTLLRATSAGSLPAQLPCFDRFPCPSSILAWIPKECLVHHKTDWSPMSCRPSIASGCHRRNRRRHAGKRLAGIALTDRSRPAGIAGIAGGFPTSLHRISTRKTLHDPAGQQPVLRG